MTLKLLPGGYVKAVVEASLSTRGGGEAHYHLELSQSHGATSLRYFERRVLRDAAPGYTQWRVVLRRRGGALVGSMRYKTLLRDKRFADVNLTLRMVFQGNVTLVYLNATVRSNDERFIDSLASRPPASDTSILSYKYKRLGRNSVWVSMKAAYTDTPLIMLPVIPVTSVFPVFKPRSLRHVISLSEAVSVNGSLSVANSSEVIDMGMVEAAGQLARSFWPPKKVAGLLQLLSHAEKRLELKPGSTALVDARKEGSTLRLHVEFPPVRARGTTSFSATLAALKTLVEEAVEEGALNATALYTEAVLEPVAPGVAVTPRETSIASLDKVKAVETGGAPAAAYAVGLALLSAAAALVVKKSRGRS